MMAPGPFAQHDASPRLPDRVEGVAIAIDSRSGAPILYGCCRASARTAEGLTDSILHNVSVIFTCGPELRSDSFPVVRHQAVFDEDITSHDGFLTGYFNVDLVEAGLPPAVGQYYVLASFHTHVSRVIPLNWSQG